MIKSHTLTSALVLFNCLSTASESVPPGIFGSTFFSLLSPSQNSVACWEDSGTSLSQNSKQALKLKPASPEVRSISSSLSLSQNSITRTSFIALLLTAHASSFSISLRISSSDLYSPITYTPPEEKLGSGFFLVLGCPCSGSGILPCSIKS